MAVTFSDACERDIRRARYVRVAVYPEVKDWLPVQVRLEVSDCPRQLGFTSQAHRAGHYLVQGAELAEVMKAVNALRGQQQRPATLEMIPCAIFMRGTLTVVLVGLAVYLAANVSMGVR